LWTPAATRGAALANRSRESGGASRDKVNPVNVDQTALLSLYMSGGAEATLTTFPSAKPTADRQRPSDGILLADVGINIPSYGLVVAQRTLDAKPDALARFVPVVIKAWEYIYADKIDEGVQAILKQRPNEKLDAGILHG